MSIIENFSASGLSVDRGDRPVFKDLNFELISGRLLKLIGPNGSGKSTLLKTLAGLIDARDGDVLADGYSLIVEDRISQSLTYLGHKNALKREFTVYENVEFWAQLWGQDDKVDQCINDMGIAYLKDTPVRYLSSGQTRRTALARTLCHSAPIWLFDEPTVGLDHQGLDLLANIMIRHLEKGGMIICATHVELGVPDHLMDTLNLADFSVSFAVQEDQL